MQRVTKDVARALIDAGVIHFVFDAPVTFKSGLKAPVYLDNRKLPYQHTAWRTIIIAMQEVLRVQDCSFDVIAGIETAGIPHSAVLAYVLHEPYVFVRKQPKDHGLQRRVEGGVVTGQRVLLIEDQVTTGSSSLSGVEALRAEGAIVEDCLAITSYGFPQAVEAFTEAGVRLHTLTTFPVILEALAENSRLDETQIAILREWMVDPHGWSQHN